MTAPSPDPTFVPITPNPFIVGNPVRGRSMFFGREAEFELVRNRFQQSDRGGLLVFCGERRSGKTSILFQILDQRLGSEFIPVLIDMQSMAISTEADFLGKIVHEVQNALAADAEVAPPEFGAGHNDTAAFQAYIKRVMREHPSRKLILLFDEYELFENKIDAGVLDADVLNMFSSLMEHQSVFFVFTGSQHLEQRRREYWKILGKSLWKQISYLERNDALRLMCEPVQGRVQYESPALEAILRLSAGQPFYTQAVCQSIVDLLNERRTARVTLPIVNEVAEGLVNNPLPQMIFLWDSLAREQKLVLALLAEALPDDRGSVGSAALMRLIQKRDYPLELSSGQLATALETSFRSELLTKDDSAQPPTYAFRMDLWRLWIRRMHSLWQVLREEGLSIHPRPGVRIGSFRVRRTWFVAGTVMLCALGWAAFVSLRGGPGPPPPTPANPGATFGFNLAVDPPDASVFVDGKLAARGAFHDSLPSGNAHAFRLAAVGYADSAFSVQSQPGRNVDRGRVALRPLLGDLRVETVPPGAQVTVDGVPRGRSPVSVRDLEVPRTHLVAAAMAGRATRSEPSRVATGKITALSLTLIAEQAELLVTSDPPGAVLTIDGVARGPAPQRATDLALGRHTFAARLDGFTSADTSLELAATTHQLHLTLVPEPPGVVVIQGDLPAQMFVDNVLVADNLQNSGAQKLRRGSHVVHVVLVSGEVIDKTIAVRPRERTVYDYTKGTITRSP